ncbi:MAG: flavoprotein [Planctomycetota bacterium]
MAKLRIIIAVSGGVAAYKSAIVVSQLVQSEHDVTCVMTSSSQKFLGKATLEALSGKKVVTDTFDSDFPLGSHIELARNSDLLCVVPATANFLSKAANGLGDDLLSTLYLCFTGPVVVAPAMNCEMWESKSVQRNVIKLVDDGVNMIGPEEGWLSCRVKGVGRMSEPETIVEFIVSQFSDDADSAKA